MNKLKQVKLMASLYCDFLNQYLTLLEELKEPQNTAEWNERCGKMQEIRKTCVEPLENMLHYLGVSIVKEEDDLIKVKFDDGTTCEWNRWL